MEGSRNAVITPRTMTAEQELVARDLFASGIDPDSPYAFEDVAMAVLAELDAEREAHAVTLAALADMVADAEDRGNGLRVTQAAVNAAKRALAAERGLE